MVDTIYDYLSVDELEEEYLKAQLIDKYDLDNEATSQSAEYARWIKIYAAARKNAKDHERKLKSVELSVGLDVRKNYKEYGFAKADLKEKVVEALVLEDPEVKKHWTLYLNADERAKMIEKVLNAYEQRKTMLRLAGDLWIKEYYIKDSIDYDEAISNARKQLDERRNRNGKKTKTSSR